MKSLETTAYRQESQGSAVQVQAERLTMPQQMVQQVHMLNAGTLSGFVGAVVEYLFRNTLQFGLRFKDFPRPNDRKTQ